MKEKGFLSIYPGWDSTHQYCVMDWNAAGDSGWMAGVFACREEAVEFANTFAKENGREFPSGEVVEMKSGVLL